MSTLKSISGDVLKCIVEYLPFESLIALFETKDKSFRRALLSPFVLPALAFDATITPEEQCFIASHTGLRSLSLNQGTLKNVIGLPFLEQFSLASGDVQAPSSLFSSISSRSLTTLKLNCTFNSAAIVKNGSATLASLFPVLTTLELREPYAPSANINAPLRRLSQALPQTLHTLLLGTSWATPAPSQLPPSITALSLLHPKAILYYALGEFTASTRVTTKDKAAVLPTVEALRVLLPHLPRLHSLTVSISKSTQLTFGAPTYGTPSSSFGGASDISSIPPPPLPLDLPSCLDTLRICSHGPNPEELGLVLRSARSITSLGFEGVGSDLNPPAIDWKVPHSLTHVDLYLVGDSRGGFGYGVDARDAFEHFWQACPSSLVSMNLISSERSNSRILASFGSGWIKFLPRTLQSLTFTESASSAPHSSMFPTANADVPWPPHLTRLVVDGEHSGLQPQADMGFQINWSKFPNLVYVSSAVTTITTEDIELLPKSLTHLHCRIHDAWQQAEVKRLVSSLPKLRRFSSSSPVSLVVDAETIPKDSPLMHTDTFKLSEFWREELGHLQHLIALNWSLSAVAPKPDPLDYPNSQIKASEPNHSDEEDEEDEDESRDVDAPRRRLKPGSRRSRSRSPKPAPIIVLRRPPTHYTRLIFDTHLVPQRIFPVSSHVTDSFYQAMDSASTRVTEITQTAPIAPALGATANTFFTSWVDSIAGFQGALFSSCIHTMHLSTTSSEIPDFSALPRTLTSLALARAALNTQPSNMGFFNAQRNPPVSVFGLPKGLTRLEMDRTTILPWERDATLPKGLTVLRFTPFEWHVEDAVCLLKTLPMLTEVHLCGPLSLGATSTLPVLSAPVPVSHVFGSNTASSTFSFAVPQTTTPTFSFGNPAPAPQPLPPPSTSGFSFGTVPASTKPAPHSSSPFSFGTPASTNSTSAFSFGTTPASSASTSAFSFGTTPANSTSAFSFGTTPATSASTSAFSFGTTPASSASTSAFSFGTAPATSTTAFDTSTPAFARTTATTTPFPAARKQFAPREMESLDIAMLHRDLLRQLSPLTFESVNFSGKLSLAVSTKHLHELHLVPEPPNVTGFIIPQQTSYGFTFGSRPIVRNSALLGGGQPLDIKREAEARNRTPFEFSPPVGRLVPNLYSGSTVFVAGGDAFSNRRYNELASTIYKGARERLPTRTNSMTTEFDLASFRSLTRLEVTQVSFDMESVRQLPKSLLHLSILLSDEDLLDPFEEFPPLLKTLKIDSEFSILVTALGVKRLPASLTKLLCNRLQIRHSVASTLPLRVTSLMLNADGQWDEEQVHSFSQRYVAAGIEKYNITIWNVALTGALLPRDFAGQLSIPTLYRLTQDALGPRVKVSFTGLGERNIKLPSGITSMDLRLTIRPTIPFPLPPNLASLFLRLSKPFVLADLEALPSTLRELQLEFSTSESLFNGYMWSCLPRQLEHFTILQVQFHENNTLYNRQGSDEHPPRAVTPFEPCLLKEVPSSINTYVTPDDIRIAHITSMPGLPESLISLTLPSYRLDGHCINHFGPQLQHLSVFHLEEASRVNLGRAENGMTIVDVRQAIAQAKYLPKQATFAFGSPYGGIRLAAALRPKLELTALQRDFSG